MLRKIRKGDIKKVLWFLVIVIVPAFVFWGASYFIKARTSYLGKIYGKKISPQDFEAFLKNIQTLLFFQLGREALSGIQLNQLKTYAWQRLLLIEKAKRENIEVTDEEVLNYIKSFPLLINRQPSSLKKRYLSILKRLGITPAQFEEFLRDLIRAEKLKEKVLKEVKVSGEEIRERFKRETEQAKAKYILIEFEKLKEEINPTEEELKSFFEENKENFRIPPKVKINYLLISPSHKDQLKKIEKEFKKKSLEEIAKKFNLEIVETDYFSVEDPIKGLGWQKEIAIKSLEAEKNKIYGPFKIEEGFIFFTKIDGKPSYIPEFSKVKGEVKERFKEKKAHQKAKELASKIISEIEEKKLKDLREVSSCQEAILSETKFFKRKDFIENIGLDMNFKNIVFSLQPGEIYLQPLEVKKGLVIVQLLEKKGIDEEKFKEEKEKYKNLILNEKRTKAFSDFIIQLIKESKLTIYKF